MVSPTSPAKAPIFSVVVHEKGGAERRELFEVAEISVGRVQGNDLMLPKGNVSKRHARLLYRDGRFIVSDLNSTNGTYVNRRRITQATLVREGDRIYIGDFILRIEPSGSASEHSASMLVPGAAGVPRPALPRPPLPTVGDSQPGASMRGIEEEDDESTRSPPRGPHSEGAAQLAEATPAGAPSIQPARTTHSDEEPVPRSALMQSISALVERVARSLPPSELPGPLSPDTLGRVDQLLRDAWSALNAERGVATAVSAERALSAARAELVSLGPLGDLLADPTVSDIAVVGHDRISVTRGGRAALSEIGFASELSLRWAIARLCERAGEPLAGAPSAVRQLPDGSVVRIRVSDVGPSVLLLQRPHRLSGTLDDLVRRGTVSRAMATFFQQCLLARMNLLLVGPRDGGVEMLLGALVAALPEGEAMFAGPFEPASARPGQRLSLDGPEDMKALLVASQAPLLRLVVELGSPGATEAVVSAIGDGSDGVIAVRSASAVRRGLLRLAAEVGAPSIGAARALVAGAFEVVIEVARLRDDRHRVLRVAELIGANDADFELADVFTFVMDRTAAGGMIEGSFVPAGAVPAVVDLIRSRGASLDSSLFARPPSR